MSGSRPFQRIFPLALSSSKGLSSFFNALFGPALKKPLLLLLPLQAMLLFWRLDLLPAWADEYATLQRAGLDTSELLAALQANVHPPLYFILARQWLELPLPFGPVVRLRVLSVLFALLATVAIDRLWLGRATPKTRGWFLLLWTFSPCLLLYARMGRSYSLQLLLAVAALHAGWRLAVEPRAKRALIYTLLATLLLYTHYLAAASVVAGVTFAILWHLLRRRAAAHAAALLIPILALAAAALPWHAGVVSSVARVAAAEPARLTGSGLLDAGLALAFAFFDFSFGETLSTWGVALAALTTPLILVVFCAGAFAAPAWVVAVAPAALVAAAGALKWVSVPFLPARLFFLLPFHLLLILRGRERLPSLGYLACVALLALSLTSIAAYFRADGFLDKAYVIPSDRIAEEIARSSPSGRVLVLLDHRRTNLEALRLHLPPGFEVRLLPQGAEGRELETVLARDDAPVIWVVRPTGAAAIEAAPERTLGRTLYVPYSKLDRILMDRIGRESQSHAIELMSIRRAR